MMSDIPKKSEYVVSEMACPDCENEHASIITHILDIPYYDDFMMVNINCSECKFRTTDFFHANSKGHIISSYLIENKEDMRTKVVRASDGIVKIPELGISIEPITGSFTWIRNIEGILEDIKSKVIIALKSFEEQELKEEAANRIEMINKLMNNEMPFTISVEDVNGNSIILPVVQEKLKIERIEKKDE